MLECGRRLHVEASVWRSTLAGDEWLSVLVKPVVVHFVRIVFGKLSDAPQDCTISCLNARRSTTSLSCSIRIAPG
jgi:hypothetical protein